jgi:DNA-binding transcriptional ArsR family regulator
VSLDNEGLVPLRALANPLRIRMVSLLTGRSLSAVEVAEELGIAHASASYHLRQLAAAGYLQRVEDGEASHGRRGQPRRRYRYDPTSALRIDRSNGRRLIWEATFTDLLRRSDQATAQRRSADAEVWLERDVWEEVCRLVDQAVRLVHDKADSPRAQDAVKISFTALLLELE